MMKPHSPAVFLLLVTSTLSMDINKDSVGHGRSNLLHHPISKTTHSDASSSPPKIHLHTFDGDSHDPSTASVRTLKRVRQASIPTDKVIQRRRRQKEIYHLRNKGLPTPPRGRPRKHTDIGLFPTLSSKDQKLAARAYNDQKKGERKLAAAKAISMKEKTSNLPSTKTHSQESNNDAKGKKVMQAPQPSDREDAKHHLIFDASDRSPEHIPNFDTSRHSSSMTEMLELDDIDWDSLP